MNESGHEIIAAKVDDSVVKALKDGSIESEKQAVKDAKQEINQEELIKVQNAPIIDELDIEKLDIKKKSVLGLNEEEQNSLNRYYFVKNTGLQPDTANLDWYENKGGKKVCRLIQLQQMPYDYAAATDIYETEILGKLYIDLSNNLGKKVILEDLKLIFEKSMHLLPTRDANKKDKGFYLDSLKDAGFIEYLKSSGDLIKSLFNISPNLAEPVKTARTILSSLFGIELEVKEKQVNEVRTRVYVPKAESIELVEQIAKGMANENINFWIDRCKDIQAYLYASTKTSPKCKELYDKLSNVLTQLQGSNTHLMQNLTGQDLANTHVR